MSARLVASSVLHAVEQTHGRDPQRRQVVGRVSRLLESHDRDDILEGLRQVYSYLHVLSASDYETARRAVLGLPPRRWAI